MVEKKLLAKKNIESIKGIRKATRHDNEVKKSIVYIISATGNKTLSISRPNMSDLIRTYINFMTNKYSYRYVIDRHWVDIIKYVYRNFKFNPKYTGFYLKANINGYRINRIEDIL